MCYDVYKSNRGELNMSIEDLTVKELISTFGEGIKKYPVKVGDSYLFRTVTHIEVGRVVEVIGQFAKIEDASWIADTGRYHNCLKDGVFDEVEPYPDYSVVNMDSLINIAPWNHALPREQK